MGGEIGRMLKSRGFFAGVLLAIAAITFGTDFPNQEAIEALLSPGTFLTLVQKALCSKIVAFLFPVAAVLPWSISFLEEWKGGYLKFSLPRSGKRNYVESKVMTVALAGFLVWIVAAAGMAFVLFLLYFPKEQVGRTDVELIKEFVCLSGRVGLIGSILSLCGGIFGVVLKSVYMAWGFPFVFWYFGIILKERYFPEAYWLYPPEWIETESCWGENNLGLWLFLLIFLLIVTGVFGSVLYRNLDEL